MNTRPSRKYSANAIHFAFLFALGLILTPAFSATNDTFRIEIQIEEPVEINEKFTVTLLAKDKNDEIVISDSKPINLIVSKWKNRRNFEIEMEKGRAEQDMTLDIIGNWIVTVRRDDKILQLSFFSFQSVYNEQFIKQISSH